VQLITFLLILAGVVAIFITTPTGRRLADRIGFRPGMKNPAPTKDREYLLRVSDDDPGVVEAKLEEARRNRPDMNEREAYRTAIREHLRDKD
jgi:hypothetical protein